MNTLRVALAVLCLLAAVAPVGAVVNPPVFKWQGPCGSFCQTGWYSSPAVTDLDGDGNPEVIWGSYDLFVYQGSSGALRARATNAQRVWPGVAVADLTGDGSKEIVVGRGGNQVHVYRFVPPSTLQVVWSTASAFPVAGEVRTLAVEDLESDGQLEVIVGRASSGQDRQVNVFNANGAQRPGWPARRAGEEGAGAGMYNENVTVADLNNDGLKEIIAPTDTHYITALHPNGDQILTHAMYDHLGNPGPTPWARVGVHVDHSVDLVGFAQCGTQHRPNFANSAPAIADLDGDGSREIVVPGDVYNCGIGDPAGDLYHLPWILRRDRSRWSGSGFDWTVLPTAEPGSGPLSQNFDVIENSVQNTVLADLDNDGRLEILVPSYDGRLHAWWLDKTEHGAWPFDVPGSGIRFASEPAVADLDNDGQAEVIFTSWGEKAGNTLGQLHIVSSQGVQLQAVNLPAASGVWNGGLGAPTLANIDGDPDLEAVVGTSRTGVIAYDLPGTANARILWGTGRGNLKRTGALSVIPVASIADAAVVEGHAGNTPATLAVTLSSPSDAAVTVAFATSPGTATTGVDYIAASGVVTFPPGSVAQNVTVPVVGDLLDEPNETFTVALSAPSGATIGDGQAQATIIDDDPPPSVSIADASVAEGHSGTTPASLPVTLSLPSSMTITVAFATSPGTATTGVDYIAASGVVTFPPGSVAQNVTVPVVGDLLDEPNETFTVALSAPSGATIGDGQAQVTINDDDAPPDLAASDCAVPEGNTGTTGCSFAVTLSGPSAFPVSLNFVTLSGSAVSGSDFTAIAGAISFAPGQAGPVFVVPAVLGDTMVEQDESFSLVLQNAVNAALPAAPATATILDDDAPSPGTDELFHGWSQAGDLAVTPDVYRLMQGPFASYEAVLDAVTGDAPSPPLLQRIAADNATVLQSAAVSASGGSHRLAWRNDLPIAVTTQSLRVGGGGCAPACGADDVYRLRLYETTYSIARFNNSATQVTVLAIQNPSEAAVSARAHFWSASGALLHVQPFSLTARGLFLLNTQTVPALAGRSGSVTIASDAPYGVLRGKAVALEPATGFAFDDAMRPRMR